MTENDAGAGDNALDGIGPPDEACGECGATSVPIVYGLPSAELFEEAERGDVMLGGCLIGEEDPTRQCVECGATFGDRSDGRKRKQKR